MQLGPISLIFGRKQPVATPISDEAREISAQVRATQKEIRMIKLRNQLFAARQEAKDVRDEWEEEADDYEPPEEPDIMQFLNAIKAYQGQGQAQLLGGEPGGLAQAPPFSPAPPIAPPPVELSKEDHARIDEIASKIPKDYKEMIKKGFVSQNYFFTLCGGVWKKLNT